MSKDNDASYGLLKMVDAEVLALLREYYEQAQGKPDFVGFIDWLEQKVIRESKQ